MSHRSTSLRSKSASTTATTSSLTLTLTLALLTLLFGSRLASAHPHPNPNPSPGPSPQLGDPALPCSPTDLGQIKCRDSTHFYICTLGQPPTLQLVAAGTECVDGKIGKAASGVGAGGVPVVPVPVVQTTPAAAAPAPAPVPPAGPPPAGEFPADECKKCADYACQSRCAKLCKGMMFANGYSVTCGTSFS